MSACSECQLLESRVAQHRSDLEQATRRAHKSDSAFDKRQAAQANQRLHRAQSYLRDHRSSGRHRGAGA